MFLQDDAHQNVLVAATERKGKKKINTSYDGLFHEYDTQSELRVDEPHNFKM